MHPLGQWPSAPATRTIAETCDEVSAALDRLLAGSAYEAEATLSIKLQDDGKVGVRGKGKILGVAVGLGVSRGSKSARTVSITFTSSGRSATLSPSDFDVALGSVREALGTIGDGYGVNDMVIDLDYSVSETGQVSVLAVGDTKDDSTHHLKVTLKPKTS